MRITGYLTMIILTVICCDYVEQRMESQEQLTLAMLAKLEKQHVAY